MNGIRLGTLSHSIRKAIIPPGFPGGIIVWAKPRFAQHPLGVVGHFAYSGLIYAYYEGNAKKRAIFCLYEGMLKKRGILAFYEGVSKERGYIVNNIIHYPFV